MCRASRIEKAGCAKSTWFLCASNSAAGPVELEWIYTCPGSARLLPAGSRIPGTFAGRNHRKHRHAMRPAAAPGALAGLQRAPRKDGGPRFSRKLELKAVHPPHGLPGVTLCSLRLDDKFLLFVRDTFEPVTFMRPRPLARGSTRRITGDPTFGQERSGLWQEVRGELRRSSFVQVLQGSCLSSDLQGRPALLSSDPWQRRETAAPCGGPRICGPQRQGRGHVPTLPSGSGRLSSEVVLSNVYHPGNERGLHAGGRAGGLQRPGRHGL